MELIGDAHGPALKLKDACLSAADLALAYQQVVQVPSTSFCYRVILPNLKGNKALLLKFLLMYDSTFILYFKVIYPAKKLHNRLTCADLLY